MNHTFQWFSASKFSFCPIFLLQNFIDIAVGFRMKSHSTMDIHPNLNVVAGFLFTFLLISSHSLPTTSASPDNGEVEEETPFTYQEETGKGPKSWGNIDPEWKVCSNGKLQSPIDLLSERVQVFPSLGKLKRGYKPAHAVLKNRGHDIIVEWQDDAGKLVINGTEYKLAQCHWHTPSEHTINHTRYEQEMHLVHKNSAGGIAVIGVLYKIGSPDNFLDKILHHIKATKVGEATELGTVNPRDVKFGSSKYYRYIGSLTVPPCTEGVIWTILKKVRTVSQEQVKTIRDAVHDGFEANARPIQELNGRQVYIYRPKA